MPKSIRSQSSSSSDRAGDDDDKDMSWTLDEYANMRKSVLKLIHRQTGIAQRFILDELDLRTIVKDMSEVSVRQRSYASTQTQHGSCEQKMHPKKADNDVNEGGGDWQMKKSQAAAATSAGADDEDIFELEWTVSFDSIQELIEYKSKYLETVGTLNEQDDDLHLPTSQSHVTMKKVGSGKYASVLSLNSSPSSPSSSVQLDHESPGKSSSSLTEMLVNLPASKDEPQVSVSIQLYFVAVVVMLTGLCLLCPYLVSTFHFIYEFEWPWSLFIREPILRGFIQSSSHFELFRYRTEDELD